MAELRSHKDCKHENVKENGNVRAECREFAHWPAEPGWGSVSTTDTCAWMGWLTDHSKNTWGYGWNCLASVQRNLDKDVAIYNLNWTITPLDNMQRLCQINMFYKKKNWHIVKYVFNTVIHSLCSRENVPFIVCCLGFLCHFYSPLLIWFLWVFS